MRLFGKAYPLHQIISANPPMPEASRVGHPRIAPTSVVGTHSMLIGDITVASDVFIGFHDVLRADAAGPFYIGPRSNVQDFVLMHTHPGQNVDVDGKAYGVYLEGEISILHHTAAHGPLYVGRNTFIGEHVVIYGARIGRNCVVMHNATIVEHVSIPEGRFVAPGQVIDNQAAADALPAVPPRYQGLNAEIVDFYERLGKSYLQHTPLVLGTPRPR